MHPWRVLLEADGALVVDKPAGLPVVPGRGDAAGPCLRHLVEQARGAPLWVVHRIDRPTTGAVVFATSAADHRRLSLAFAEGRVRRTYLAWVLGVPAPPAGVIDLPVAEGRHGAMRVAPGGRPSRTAYRVLRALGDRALVEARLESGRRHQVRVHLGWRGHPVLFDAAYAGPARERLEALRARLDQPAAPPWILLHAHALAWTGADGRAVQVLAPPPPPFAALG